MKRERERFLAQLLGLYDSFDLLIFIYLFFLSQLSSWWLSSKLDQYLPLSVTTPGELVLVVTLVLFLPLGFTFLKNSLKTLKVIQGVTAKCFPAAGGDAGRRSSSGNVAEVSIQQDMGLSWGGWTVTKRAAVVPVQASISDWVWQGIPCSQLLHQIAVFISCLGYMSNWGRGGGHSLPEACMHLVWLCVDYKLHSWVFLHFTYRKEFLPSVPIAKRLNSEPSGKHRKSISCRKHCFHLNFIDTCLASLTFGWFLSLDCLLKKS